mmetsp:Transcript_28525/g.55861  ORF Transcript_28525/g.55861 Transcript_28525/m.55861 type:complete len:236 (+) Transcript_28525:445-1152(+)
MDPDVGTEDGGNQRGARLASSSCLRGERLGWGPSRLNETSSSTWRLCGSGGGPGWYAGSASRVLAPEVESGRAPVREGGMCRHLELWRGEIERAGPSESLWECDCCDEGAGGTARRCHVWRLSGSPLFDLQGSRCEGTERGRCFPPESCVSVRTGGSRCPSPRRRCRCQREGECEILWCCASRVDCPPPWLFSWRREDCGGFGGQGENEERGLPQLGRFESSDAGGREVDGRTVV